MQLHPTVIEKLIRIYTNYGGYREENRLRTELQNLSLTEYTQQTGQKKSFLVLSEDIQNHISDLKTNK